MKILVQWFKQRFSDPQVFVLAGLIALIALLIFWTGHLMAPIFTALVLAYLLEGLIAWLQRRGIRRGIAVTVVFTVFLLALMVGILIIVPLLYRQFTQLIQQFPTIVTWGKQQLLTLPQRYPELISADQITQFMNTVQAELGNFGQRLVTVTVATVRGLTALLVYLLLIPLMIFFMLKDKTLLINWFKRFLPDDHRLSEMVWHDIDQQIGKYIRGKVVEIMVIWAASALAFSLIGLQAATLFGFFVGLSVLIPYVGVTVMAFPVALMAYFQWGFSAPFAYSIGAYTVIQLVDGNLLAPLLLADVVNLHPLAVVVAVLITGGLWGFWGVFFAIPLATVVQAILRALPARPPDAPPLNESPAPDLSSDER